jgi:hypothetical protein
MFPLGQKTSQRCQRHSPPSWFCCLIEESGSHVEVYDISNNQNGGGSLALRPDTGLHLDRTKPPILEILHNFEQVYGAQPVLYVTEVHEVNEPKALKAVEAAFDWSDLRIYDVNAPGLQHGVLLGTCRWPW